jgi:hypothetical protein
MMSEFFGMLECVAAAILIIMIVEMGYHWVTGKWWLVEHEERD